MDKALLDTDIFSEILKGIDQTVIQRALAYRVTYSRYTTSAITVLEIVKGLHKVGREHALQRFLVAMSTVELLTPDLDSADLAGRIYADLERTGQPIGRADPIVAAIALRQGLVLVTGNLRHYRRIQSLGYALMLEDWREPAGR